MNSQPKCKASKYGHRTYKGRMACPSCRPRIEKARAATMSLVAAPKLKPDEEYRSVLHGPTDEVWLRLTDGMEEADVIPGDWRTDGEPLGYHMQPGRKHSWQSHYGLGFEDPNQNWVLNIDSAEGQPWAWDHCYARATSARGQGSGRGTLSGGTKDGRVVSPFYMNDCDFEGVGIKAGPGSLIRGSKFTNADVELDIGSGMTKSSARRVIIKSSSYTSAEVSSTVLKDVEAEEVIILRQNNFSGTEVVQIADCKAPVIYVGRHPSVEVTGSGEQVFIVAPGRSTDSIRYPDGDAIFIKEHFPFKDSSRPNFPTKTHTPEGSSEGLTDNVRKQIGLARLAKAAGIDRKNESALAFIVENTPNDHLFGVDEWGRPAEGGPTEEELSMAALALRMFENPA